MMEKYILINREQPWIEMISCCDANYMGATEAEIVAYIAENEMFEGDFIVTVCV